MPFYYISVKMLPILTVACNLPKAADAVIPLIKPELGLQSLYRHT